MTHSPLVELPHGGECVDISLYLENYTRVTMEYGGVLAWLSI